MKRKIYCGLILVFFVTRAYADIYTRNIIVHLKDKSRIIANDFNVHLSENYVYNPYVRVKSLNISLINYTSPEDKLKHSLSAYDLYNKVKEMDFVEDVHGEKNRYIVKFIFSNNKEIIPNDVKFFKYKGFKTPTEKITVLKYDEYNKTWIPSYIKLAEVEKIEFRQIQIPVYKKTKIKKSDTDKKHDGYKRKVLFSSDDSGDGNLFESLLKSLRNFKTNKASIVLRVNFPFNSYILNRKAESFLDVVVKVLSMDEFKALKLRLVGFTDNVGKEKYNKRLSIKRASAVRSYLVKKGHINFKSLKIEGYGFKMPIAPNTTEYYRSLNRRVEILPLIY